MLKNYFKIAFRNLQRHKAYTVINIMGLALGMTCAILIFTLVKYHLSFDNFHSHSNRIYRIVTEMHRDNIGYNRCVPAPLGKSFREDYTFGEKVARIATFTNQLITIKNAGKIKKIKEAEGLAFTESDFFEIFNYPLIQGNKKTVLSEPNTAILTEKMAKKFFEDENPIGKTFLLDNKIAFTVTGILKDLPANTDIKTEIYVSYSTLKLYNEWLASDDSWGGILDAMQCFVLLRPNITVAQVENVMPAYVKKFRPTSKNVHHYQLQPLSDIHFNGHFDGAMEKKNLWILSFIGLFLIVTACVNFINLATAQALNRSKEVGVRKVLGSLQGQLFWQFISETGVITLFSATLALGLAFLLLPFVNHWFKVQMAINLFSDWQLAVFIPILALLVTFFAGSYPGLVMSGFQPILALKGKISQRNIGGFTTRRVLIVTQFTISQVLVIGMIVIANQMQYSKQSDLGFDKDAIVMIPIGSSSQSKTMSTLKNKLSQIPGVEKISLCYAAPSSDEAWNNSITFDNQSEEVLFRTSIKSADEQYIPTFGLELVAGRNIYPSDSVKEFLVNEAFTRKLNFQKPEAVIGKMISANDGNMVGPIVGIIKDFHDRSFHQDINAVCITTYASIYEKCAVKINMKNAKSTLAALEKTWNSIYPDQIYEYKFLDESIAKFYETEELMLKIIQVFSLIAIFIGCLGLYGLVSFMAVQKTKEIGIRKVLGAGIGNILWLFGKEFARLIVIAFAIAAPLAWYVMNLWLQDFKYRIEIGAGVFGLAILSTLAIAALTVGYRSVQSALMNPVKSLRTE